MSRIETSLLVNRPLHEVWDFFAQVEMMPAWSCGLREVHQITGGPIGVGTQFSSVIQFLGREEKETQEIVAYEPYKHVAYKVVELAHEVIDYTFEPMAGSTNIILNVEFTRDPADPLPEPLFASVLRRYAQFDLETLKDLVEARAAVPA